MKVLTSDQEWVRTRVTAVLDAYSAFEALTENGVELVDKDTDLQIRCPWHGADNKPSGRYYSRPYPHFHCYTCKLHLNGIDVYAKFRGMEFMRALSELERRFSIKIPRRPEVSVGLPMDRSGAYESEAWADVPRVLVMLETKLSRLRDRVALLDYVKWCRVVDAVRWDLDRSGGNGTPDMVAILMKLKSIMEDHSRRLVLF